MGRRALTGAIFLDRDGTINEMTPGEYVLDRASFRFLPGALDALAFLAKNLEKRIVVVTNQPAIGRGLATRAQVDDLHRWMTGEIEAAGGRVDAVYVCPHTSDEGCNCRKPRPGLLLQAARDLGLDLGASCLVGDTKGDLQAAWAAGVNECHLVLTGVPRKQFPDSWNGRRYDVMADLADAARFIVVKENHT